MSTNTQLLFSDFADYGDTRQPYIKHSPDEVINSIRAVRDSTRLPGTYYNGQRRTRTDTLSRMILSQLRLPIPPVALIYSMFIITHSWVI
jgi:hypothetical protein